jgi:hypothetical protein
MRRCRCGPPACGEPPWPAEPELEPEPEPEPEPAGGLHLSLDSRTTTRARARAARSSPAPGAATEPEPSEGVPPIRTWQQQGEEEAAEIGGGVTRGRMRDGKRAVALLAAETERESQRRAHAEQEVARLQAELQATRHQLTQMRAELDARLPGAAKKVWPRAVTFLRCVDRCEGSDSTVTFYEIEVHAVGLSSKSWRVERRYTQFEMLQKQLAASWHTWKPLVHRLGEIGHTFPSKRTSPQTRVAVRCCSCFGQCLATFADFSACGGEQALDTWLNSALAAAMSAEAQHTGCMGPLTRFLAPAAGEIPTLLGQTTPEFAKENLVALLVAFRQQLCCYARTVMTSNVPSQVRHSEDWGYWSVDGVQLDPFKLAIEPAMLDVNVGDDGTIQIKLTGISVVTEIFRWQLKRTSFPPLEGAGVAMFSLQSLDMSVSFGR